MPHLNDDEIDNLVSRAVAKALGDHQNATRTDNARAVSEVTNASNDDRLMSVSPSAPAAPKGRAPA